MNVLNLSVNLSLNLNVYTHPWQASASSSWRVGAELPRDVVERAHTVLLELLQVSAASQPDAPPSGARLRVAEHLAG